MLQKTAHLTSFTPSAALVPPLALSQLTTLLGVQQLTVVTTALLAQALLLLLGHPLLQLPLTPLPTPHQKTMKPYL